MSENTGSNIAIACLFCLIFAVIGFLVYDLVFYYPRAVISFTNDFTSVKTDIPFKLNVNIVSLNYSAKNCTAGLEFISPDGRAILISEQALPLMPGKTVPLVFEAVISSKNITGNYTAVVYLSGRRSMFFGSKSRFAELRKEFGVAQKIIDGTLELKSPVGIVTCKPGSKLLFGGTAANTGETEQYLSIDCIITPPEGVEINLGVTPMTLAVQEKKDFSFTFEVPAAPAGKYKARVSLFAGNPNLPSGQKLIQLDREFMAAKSSEKAAFGGIKPRGSFKCGGKAGFDVSFSNAGDAAKTFSVEAVVLDPSGKVKKLPGKEVALGSKVSKKLSYDISFASSGPSGKYTLSLTAYSGKAGAAGRAVLDRSITGFTVENSVSAGAAEISQPANVKLGANTGITAKFINSGGSDREFFAVIEASGPSGGIYPLLGEKVALKKGESKSFTKEFIADASMPDAKYKVTASIWDKAGEDGRPVNKFGEQAAEFSVIDNPPTLSNFVYVAPALEKPGIITIKAKDDKGLKEVRLVYKGPGMTEYAKESMIKTGGTDKNGWDYSIQTGTFTSTGSFMFYVEAIDLKGQQTKTSEEKTEIK